MYTNITPSRLKHRSPGITAIFNELKSQAALRVLDLATSSGQTFNFFSSLSCQIHFENLDEFLTTIGNTTPPHDEMVNLLEDYLTDFPATKKFDLILTWDLFNYLEIDTVHWLLKRLSRNCKENTLIHTIGYVANQIPHSPRRFHIIDQNEISAATFSDIAERRHNKFSSVSLMKGLPQFHIEHSYLNYKGMLPGFIEQLLRFQPEGKKSLKLISNQGIQDELEQNQQRGANHQSAALAKVFATLRSRSRPKLLDLGLKNSHNYRVLQPLCGNLHHEDVHRSVKQKIYAGKSPSFSAQQFNTAGDKQFDIILLWDLLNFLPDNLIAELFSRLKPLTSKDTLIHAVIYSGRQAPANPQNFRLSGDDALEIYNATDQTQVAPLTSSKILKAMPDFEFAESFVYRPGMQRGIIEYLFRPR